MAAILARCEAPRNGQWKRGTLVLPPVLLLAVELDDGEAKTACLDPTDRRTKEGEDEGMEAGGGDAWDTVCDRCLAPFNEDGDVSTRDVSPALPCDVDDAVGGPCCPKAWLDVRTGVRGGVMDAVAGRSSR